MSSEFYELFAKAQAEYNQREREWVVRLREEGIKGAHPDDGWVNRESNEICFCYPQFNDDAGVGDRVALGNHERHRVVRLTDARRGLFTDLKYWKFEEEK